jgi:manganese/zinc/iron transport system substrate-binding protein
MCCFKPKKSFNITKTFFACICLIGLSLLLVACSNQGLNPNKKSIWSNQEGKLKVLSTTSMINNLVEEISGDLVEVNTLIEGGLDPHSYELVKGDDEKVQIADVIFYNGLGLEHGPSLNKYLKESGKAIGLGNVIRNKYPSFIIEDAGQVDPHIWMDMSLWALNIETIVDVLSQKDPSHQDIFEERGQQLFKKLKNKHDEFVVLFQSIPKEKRYLVTSHDAFNYFTKAYLKSEEELDDQAWRQRFNAPEGLAPEGQISVKDIKNIINHMKKYNIKVIFAESNVSRDSIKKIVDAGNKEGLNFCISDTSLYADAMGKPGTFEGTYLGMMEFNAKTIASYLIKNDACESKQK